jgi:hypothetical protein
MHNKRQAKGFAIAADFQKLSGGAGAERRISNY